MSSPEEGTVMEYSDEEDSEDAYDHEPDLQIPAYLCKIITQLIKKYENIKFPHKAEQLNNVLYSQIASNLTLMTLLIEFGATVTKISIP